MDTFAVERWIGIGQADPLRHPDSDKLYIIVMHGFIISHHKDRNYCTEISIFNVIKEIMKNYSTFSVLWPLKWHTIGGAMHSEMWGHFLP